MQGLTGTNATITNYGLIRMGDARVDATLLALVPGLAAIHFYSGAGACCYTFLMLWDVFGAHVVNVFGASFP